jgi:hypothetical protein
MDRGERDRATRAIAVLLVQLDRARVARCHVQEWRVARGEDLVAADREQVPREALAGEVRVRAHRADLLVAGERHANAEHGLQEVAVEHTDVAAEVHRASAEVVRIDERDQLEDPCTLGVAEHGHRRTRQRRERRLADHLHDVPETLGPIARRHRGHVAEHHHGLARRDQLVEITRERRRIGHREERQHVCGVAQRAFIAQSERSVVRAQRRPERVVEWVRHPPIIC